VMSKSSIENIRNVRTKSHKSWTSADILSSVLSGQQSTSPWLHQSCRYFSSLLHGGPSCIEYQTHLTYRTYSSANSKLTYYEVLGVTSQASGREIKQAFLRLSKIHHPDKNINNTSSSSSDKFQAISEAYEVLGNPSLRSKYDVGVLGRSSSVAEREVSSHRYDKESFYGSLSKSGEIKRDEPVGTEMRNLDKWTKQQRSISFRLAQESRQQSKTDCGGSSVHYSQQQLNATERKNRNFVASFSKFISTSLMIILVIILIVKNL